MQRLQQTMLLPLRRQPHRQPVQRRHRHHLRLLQKMRRPDKRQQRKVVPRQQQRKHQRRQAVRRLHLRAKLLLNPRQRAPRQQQKRAEDIASAVALEDASTTKKGIVQLSSATNSTSEKLAATPKAVKTVKDSSVQKLATQWEGS